MPDGTLQLNFRVHIVMTEALERLLFNHFIQCSSKQKQARKLFSDIYSFKTNINNEELNKVLECESFSDLFMSMKTSNNLFAEAAMARQLSSGCSTLTEFGFCFNSLLQLGRMTLNFTFYP